MLKASPLPVVFGRRVEREEKRSSQKAKMERMEEMEKINQESQMEERTLTQVFRLREPCPSHRARPQSVSTLILDALSWTQ